VAAIQERVTSVLRSIPKEAFADSFQKLYECCQQCVVKDGDCFECQKFNLFVFWYHSPNFLDTLRVNAEFIIWAFVTTVKQALAQKYINKILQLKVSDPFYLQYSHQHVSVGMPGIFKVILLL
jgi:hypothetical protein